MPATEQTWYNQKTLHVVFGLSSLVMFLSTIWLFAADHDREWKGYQRRFREVELRLNEWQQREAKSVEQATELAAIEKDLLFIQTNPPTRQDFAEFKKEVLDDELKRGELTQAEYDQRLGLLRDWRGGAESGDPAFEKLNASYARIASLAEGLGEYKTANDESQSALQAAEDQLATAKKQMEAAESPEDRAALEETLQDAERALAKAESAAKKAEQDYKAAASKVKDSRVDLIGQLQTVIGKAQFRAEQASSRKKFRSADFDAAKANLDLAVRDGKTDEMPGLQEKIDKVTDDPNSGLKVLTSQSEDATAHRDNLQRLFRKIEGSVDELEAKKADNLAEIDLLESNFVERRSTWFTGSPPFLGKRWLELPILDAFGSPLKIDNLWTEGLTLANGSFGRVRRFDRCTTCHKGIDKTQSGSAVEPLYEPSRELEILLHTPDSAARRSGRRGCFIGRVRIATGQLWFGRCRRRHDQHDCGGGTLPPLPKGLVTPMATRFKMGCWSVM